MPVEVVGVTVMMTISPTARRGISATWMFGPLVLVIQLPSIDGGRFWVSSAVDACKREYRPGRPQVG